MVIIQKIFVHISHRHIFVCRRLCSTFNDSFWFSR